MTRQETTCGKLIRLLNELLRNAEDIQHCTGAVAEQQSMEGFPSPREFQKHSSLSAAFWGVTINQPVIDYPNSCWELHWILKQSQI